MNKSDTSRNAYTLTGRLAKKGYMRWWHSFTGIQPDTGEERVFFIEYFMINPALAGDTAILGQHPYYKKRGIKPSYVMIKAGAFTGSQGACPKQLHSFYPFSQLKTAVKPFVFQVGPNFYSESRIYGNTVVNYKNSHRRSYMCDEGRMEWDLEIHKAISGHTGHIADPFFCMMNALDTFWHGEGLQAFYRGRVVLDGVLYQVSPESSYGYADKHWGRRFNSPWLTFASCRLTGSQTGKALKHSALAIDGCCPRFLCFPLKHKLLLQLTYEGQDYTFRFARTVRKRSKWHLKETGKRFVLQLVAVNKETIIKITVNCLKEGMLSLHYESPDGERFPEPLLGDGSAAGTILIYQKSKHGKKLIDTLDIRNGFFECGEIRWKNP